MILQKSSRTSSAELRTKLNMTTLERRCRNNMICQIHRCLLNQAPSYLSSKFSTNSSFGYTSTHGSSKIHLKRPVSEFYRSSFEYHGAKLYNDLPESIRTSRALALFVRPWTNSLSLSEPTNFIIIIVYNVYIFFNSFYSCLFCSH